MIGLLKYLTCCLLSQMIYGLIEITAQICAQLREGWSDDAGEFDSDAGSQGADAGADGDDV